MKHFLFAMALFAALFAAPPCKADIYRLEGDDEVVTFTDSPRAKGFRLVQKEQHGRTATRGSGKFVNRTNSQEPLQQSIRESDGSARILPVQGRITSPTGMRSDPFDGKLKHHNGLDIAAPPGTPVKPVAPGTIIFSGWKKGYGNTVILEHNDGMVTVYAHHASNSVNVGDAVTMNTVIALTGSTGRSTGPHLHFEAWRRGINITSEFVPGVTTERGPGAMASAPINRYLQADGTIVFTNIR